MLTRILLATLLVSTTFGHARDKNENWIQITSPHFVVVTNSSEKQGRRIADQFERMRSLFHAMFPKVQMDSAGAPIVVLAIKDEKDFRALEPEAYLAKGSLKLGGLFMPAFDKNYVLMRVDAEEDHPYAVIYHEYTHFLLRESAEWMPLWLNEGLAEFYENTDIYEKDASVGQPSAENIGWLRQHPLLPLPTLFTVDHNSSYYHEENKGSIFYAQSWVLVHYIEMRDLKEKTQRLVDYSTLLTQKVDPVTAAERAFGDLKKLQEDLNTYVQRLSFPYLKMATKTEVDDSGFKAQQLTTTQSDALRADFLAYESRTKDAQVLLDRVLQEDPKNVSAHETEGYLEFRQGHMAEAKNWYSQAVQLDSQSFLAHYYFAAMAMNGGNTAEQQQVETSLRTSLKLNASFAPALDLLAVYYAMQHKNLDEAHTLELNAITLDPANVNYRINMANVLMAMENGERAVEVLRAAAKLAKTPQESQMVNNVLTHAVEYNEMRAKVAAQKQAWEKSASVTTQEAVADPAVPRLKHRDFVAKGPHRFAVGVLKGVRCDNPGLDLTVSTKEKQLAVHGDNYYKITFSTLGFTPSGDLNPCKDLENRPAKVEYVDSADPSVPAQLLSVELHK